MHQPSWEYFDVVQEPPPLIRWETPKKKTVWPKSRDMGTGMAHYQIYIYIYMVIYNYIWLYIAICDYIIIHYISIFIHLLYCPYLSFLFTTKNYSWLGLHMQRSVSSLKIQLSRKTRFESSPALGGLQDVPTTGDAFLFLSQIRW